MRQKQFKIKNTATGLFWNGYSSSFSESGTVFSSYEDAGLRIDSQFKMKYDVSDWIKTAEVVEYEIIIQEKETQTAKHCVMVYRFHEYLGKQYGVQFLRSYKKIKSDKSITEPYNYAVNIKNSVFPEFRESLKGLGYSSRHYKKVDEWIWVRDPEVVARIKLLSFDEKIVPIADEEKALNALIPVSTNWQIS
jgi:hypothetical protein